MLRVGCRFSAVSPIYMSNDRLEPFNYHNIAFKRCADVVSLERFDRLWFFRHHWFVKIGWFGKCWTDLLAFWGVWNRSRILNFGPNRLFFRFSRALILSIHISVKQQQYFYSCTHEAQLMEPSALPPLATFPWSKTGSCQLLAKVMCTLYWFKTAQEQCD